MPRKKCPYSSQKKHQNTTREKLCQEKNAHIRACQEKKNVTNWSQRYTYHYPTKIMTRKNNAQIRAKKST